VALLVFLAAPADGATRKLAGAAEPTFRGGAWKFQRGVRNSELPLMQFADVTVRPTRTIAKDGLQNVPKNYNGECR
jgi:hypothetical protein